MHLTAHQLLCMDMKHNCLVNSDSLGTPLMGSNLSMLLHLCHQNIMPLNILTILNFLKRGRPSPMLHNCKIFLFLDLWISIKEANELFSISMWSISIHYYLCMHTGLQLLSTYEIYWVHFWINIVKNRIGCCMFKQKSTLQFLL